MSNEGILCLARPDGDTPPLLHHLTLRFDSPLGIPLHLVIHVPSRKHSGQYRVFHSRDISVVPQPDDLQELRPERARSNMLRNLLLTRLRATQYG